MSGEAPENLEVRCSRVESPFEKAGFKLVDLVDLSFHRIQVLARSADASRWPSWDHSMRQTSSECRVKTWLVSVGKTDRLQV